MEASTISNTATNSNNQHEHESKDEVDFVVVATNNNNNSNNNNNIKHNINNNYEMNINKTNNSNINKLTTAAAATENKQINNSNMNNNNNNSKNINNNNNNHRSNNNSSEIVPNSLVLKETTTQNQVPKNNKDSSVTSTTPAPNMQNNNNSMKNNNKKKITVAEQQPQQTKKHSTKERLSLFSFSKKISQKSPVAAATSTTIYNASSSNNSSSTNIGSYKDNTTETTTPATPNTTSYESENQSRNAALEKYKPLALTTSDNTPAIPIGTPPRQHKFVKSTSISRLFGNTYNAKKFEKQEQKRLANDNKFNTYGGRRRASGPYLERFKHYAKEQGDEVDTNIEVTDEARDLNAEGGMISSSNNNHRSELQHSSCTMSAERHEVLGAKAMRTISRGLGKLWWKRTHSVDISTPDPEFKVSYLGNVLTGWAKGEGCVEKQLNTLWRNYTQNSKPDVIMRIKVCASGLKATTRQHGLTEYWANRITHCCAPKNYPRVFCWIYRHEGRKLKHELRCHAVLCSKEKIVQDICNTLKENLERALREFKREKILKQNARLSLANAAYDNPSLPRRKILLSVGGNNYRPPLERSKSAPKLMAIEEAIGEEDGDDIEETNEPEMKSCCQKDSLYPAMTLGRRRCRRGHSIRRTGGKARASVSFAESAHKHAAGECCKEHHHETKDKVTVEKLNTKNTNTDENNDEQRNSYGSDESDDFEKLLKYNNYDTNASLEHELLPYFEMQLHKNHSSLGDLTELKDEIEQPLSLMPTINSAPNADPEAEYIPTDVADDDDDENDQDVMVGLRRNGVCSDGEEDYLDADDMYFRQASILNMLHRNSMRKMANLSLSSGDESSSIETNASSAASLQYHHQLQSSISSNGSSTGTAASSALDGGDTAAKEAAQRKQQQLNADSDEGSISSGCETASTVTANQDDISLKYRQQSMQRTAAEVVATFDAAQLMMSEHGALDEEPITADEIYQRLESRLQRRQNSDATTFSSSSSITLKMGSSSPTTSMSGGGGCVGNDMSGNGVGSCAVNARTRRQRRQTPSTQSSSAADGDSDDSECSDESGYVEFQERDKQLLMREGEFSLNAEPIKQQQQLQQASKPQPPPKPMPRRLLLSTSSTSTAV